MEKVTYNLRLIMYIAKLPSKILLQFTSLPESMRAEEESLGARKPTNVVIKN